MPPCEPHPEREEEESCLGCSLRFFAAALPIGKPRRDRVPSSRIGHDSPKRFNPPEAIRRAPGTAPAPLATAAIPKAIVAAEMKYLGYDLKYVQVSRALTIWRI